MSKHLAIFAFAFLMIFFSTVSNAQIKPIDPNIRTTQIRAVIIGISKYADSLNFENLNYADKDAEAYADFLMSPAGGSVPKTNIALLRNEEATRMSIIEAMTEKFGPAQSQDILIFFFSGHGESAGFGKSGLLCPSDILKRSINATGLKMNELDEMFNSKAKIKMTLIDACHAGLFKKQDPSQLDRTKSNQQIQKISEINTSIQEYLNMAPTGNISILSCQGIQESKEMHHLKHGVFTYYLLKGLQGEADNFLKESKDDGDGNITVRELYGYIHEGVMRTTQNHQIPLLSNTLPQETVIAKCEPNKVKIQPVKLENFGSFNKVDPDSTHRYATRILDFEEPAINFECPTDTVSGLLILEFTFSNPTIAKNVEFIHVEINKYYGKIGKSLYLPVYSQVFKPQEGVNRFAIENHMAEKNIEVQIGYALKKKPADKGFHYYHVSCISPGSEL